MKLHDVHKGIHKARKRRRLGRGPGSGHGKTSSRGHKGAKSRAGYSRHPAFQGGAMPMVRRVPKRGFNNRFALVVAEINIRDLERAFESGDEVTPEVLRQRSLVKGRYDVLKVLGTGELTKKLKVAAHRFSQTAREKIEQAGGEALVLPGKRPVADRDAGTAKAAATANAATPADADATTADDQAADDSSAEK